MRVHVFACHFLAFLEWKDVFYLSLMNAPKALMTSLHFVLYFLLFSVSNHLHSSSHLPRTFRSLTSFSHFLFYLFHFSTGALVQSLQYVFEEKVMSAGEDDPNMAPTPPLLLVSLICAL